MNEKAFFSRRKNFTILILTDANDFLIFLRDLIRSGVNSWINRYIILHNNFH